jgi:hypothetical protein
VSVGYIKSQILHLKCSVKIVGNFDKVHLDIINQLFEPEQTVLYLVTGIVCYSLLCFLVLRVLH